MKAILSIKPEFVEKIIRGEKKFEFRRKIFSKDVDTVIVYATSPIKAIVGEFTIDEIIYDKLNHLWKITQRYSGIDKSFFNEYFKNKEKGYAIKIKRFNKYDDYISLHEFGLSYPPQSYVYVDIETIQNFMAKKAKSKDRCKSGKIRNWSVHVSAV